LPEAWRVAELIAVYAHMSVEGKEDGERWLWGTQKCVSAARA